MLKTEEAAKIVLDENRMLVLAVQVLLGFAFQAVFQPGFTRLFAEARVLHFAAFLLLIVTFALLLTIPSSHLLSWKGRDNRRFFHFATVILGWVLLPFAAALSIEFGIVAGKITTPETGMAAAVIAVILCLAAWYFYPLAGRKSAPHEHLETEAMKTEIPPLKDRINQILTECRVVLPGTQALLGFQLIACFTDAFDRLPRASQLVHLAGLAATVVSIILLMLPTAFHRLREHGRDSERLYRLASRTLLTALGFLSIGLASDFFVVSDAILNALPLAAASASAAFALLVSCWFLLPLLARKRCMH